jgi:hypothetical protein
MTGFAIRCWGYSNVVEYVESKVKMGEHCIVAWDICRGSGTVLLVIYGSVL